MSVCICVHVVGRWCVCLFRLAYVRTPSMPVKNTVISYLTPGLIPFPPFCCSLWFYSSPFFHGEMLGLGEELLFFLYIFYTFLCHFTEIKFPKHTSLDKYQEKSRYSYCQWLAFTAKILKTKVTYSFNRKYVNPLKVAQFLYEMDTMCYF